MGYKVVPKDVQDINRQRKDDIPGGINCLNYFESIPR